jgi:transcription termination factor Rho
MSFTPGPEPMPAPQGRAEAALSAKYETMKAETPQLAQLRKLGTDELKKIARERRVEIAPSSDPKKLSFELMKALVCEDGCVFGEGVLEVLPAGFGFLRRAEASYLASPGDIYVSQSQIRRFGMRAGQLIQGQIRPPKGEERFAALLRVEAIGSELPEAIRNRTRFDDLVPIHPAERLRLESGPEPIATRILDLWCPIGKGQRGLIVAAPRTGKTILLKQIATAIIANHPEVTVIMLLIDERPEEVTDIRRTVPCEVVSSTFDEQHERHLQIAEIVLQKARRLVEAGKDVVVLLDSITRLARAYNSDAPGSGKVLSGGVDAAALQRPKRFFGSARATENGGSLTVLATALVDTGSRMDEVIFEEFKGTGNLEIVLDRRLADRRVYPAFDLGLSGTRREALLLAPEDLRRVSLLRQVMSDMNPFEAMELLSDRMLKTRSNREFLASIQG